MRLCHKSKGVSLYDRKTSSRLLTARCYFVRRADLGFVSQHTPTNKWHHLDGSWILFAGDSTTAGSLAALIAFLLRHGFLFDFYEGGAMVSISEGQTTGTFELRQVLLSAFVRL